MIPVSYNFRSLFVRKATTLATALGIGLVVFVLASALMLSAGVRKTFLSGGREDQAVVLRHGSDTEIASVVETTALNQVAAAAGVQRDTASEPLAAGEFVMVLVMEKLGTEGQVSNVQVRGITESSLKVHDGIRVVAGRLPKLGADEAIIGKGLVGRFQSMRLGERLELRKNRPVTVVGVFEAGGTSFESEVWGDLNVVRNAFGRGDLLSSITVRLQSPRHFDAFRATVENDKRLALEAQREHEYYEKQSMGTRQFITGVGILLAFFFGIGAVIGAVITMYSTVAQREREIGVLRALGFSRISILVGFLIEAILLSLAGGLIGVLGALAMSFAEIPMTNFVTWQEITFSFDPHPVVLAAAVAAGCGMGILGGLFPALRAARVSPLAAIRG